MKLVKFLAIVIMVLAAAFLYRLWSLGQESQTMVPPVGLVDGSLRPCESNGHCVSSLSQDPKSAVEPLPLQGEDADASMASLTAAIRTTGGTIVTQQENYLHATYQSGVFQFVDDLEVHIIDGNTAQVRSASRVGKSDLGANRKRVEALRDELEP